MFEMTGSIVAYLLYRSVCSSMAD
ncbi:MAG: hypothetical protein IMX00_02495 [Limnochordales bacterium]|nr:hypothetical protein [Limnochordales bacterium]